MIQQRTPVWMQARWPRRKSFNWIGAARFAYGLDIIQFYPEYQTVAIARLHEILDAIGIKALVTLSA